LECGSRAGQLDRASIDWSAAASDLASTCHEADDAHAGQHQRASLGFGHCNDFEMAAASRLRRGLRGLAEFLAISQEMA